MYSFGLFGFRAEMHLRSIVEWAGLIFAVDVLWCLLWKHPVRVGDGLAFSISLTVLIFASTALHELAHAIVARAAGLTVEKIVLGDRCFVRLSDDIREAKPQWGFVISVAGVLANWTLVIVLVASLLAADPQGVPRDVIAWGILWEVGGTLDLLPFGNSDGVKALYFLRRLRSAD